jgi:hypothetical protein
MANDEIKQSKIEPHEIVNNSEQLADHVQPGFSFSSLLSRKVGVETSHERLALVPSVRIGLAASVAGFSGFIAGIQSGARQGSLQFLAENAHRMPRTKGAWYFYHKRKNYVIMQRGINSGVKVAVKYGTITFAYFGLEAYLDRIRGVLDFGNTMAAAGVVGFSYGLYSQTGIKNALRMSRSYVIFGTIVGLIQDGVRYARGNDLWYVAKLKRDLIS